MKKAKETFEIYFNKKMCLPFQSALTAALILCAVSGCSGKRPDGIGVGESGLGGCPQSPNCVSSEATDPRHAIEPFRLKGDAGETWPLIRDHAASMPGWTVVTATGTYMHVACRSRVFRFVDDLELYYHSSTGVVAVRSASRIGYSDFGVNRRRVEALRRALRTRRLIE